VNSTSVPDLINTVRNARPNDGIAWDRAVDAACALPSLAPNDPVAQEAVISHLERLAADLQLVSPAYARRLAMFGDGFPERVGLALGHATDLEYRGTLLVTLVKMGDRAQAQAGALVKGLDEKRVLGNGSADEVDELARSQQRVAVAALGAARPDDLRRIEKDIAARTPAGGAALGLMAEVGLGNWGTDAMVAELKRNLGERDDQDAAILSALILGVSNRLNGADLQKVIELWNSTNGASIPYTCALAVADKPRAETYWRAACQPIGRLQGMNHTDVFALEMYCVSMPMDDIVILRRLTKCEDPDVAAGAATVLEIVERFVAGAK
jgi:hypothetical protein